jgi:DNA-directed RNA polymerase II subunit RPB1
VLDTVGTNLIDVLALDYIDNTRTFSNNIIETYAVLGIEAARQAIYNELAEVIEFDGTYINYHHLSLLCDRMSYNTKMVSIFRHGINNDNIGPIAKASFEETPEMFLKAARHGEMDIMRGVSANIMCGQEGYFGTSSFQVVVDLEMLKDLQEEKLEQEIELENALMMDSGEQKCSSSELQMTNNVQNIKYTQNIDDGYIPDF